METEQLLKETLAKLKKTWNHFTNSDLALAKEINELEDRINAHLNGPKDTVTPNENITDEERQKEKDDLPF